MSKRTLFSMSKLLYITPMLANHIHTIILEKVPGTGGHRNSASFYYVRAFCEGLMCPPFIDAKDLACVVCSK
uniref:Uncharacterized protein n=1 Tax=Amphimedon queenslandica TaxID=400682 RepID=A0A1X7TP90_AMPQE